MNDTTVKDILGNNTLATIILESPHTDELENSIPLAGPSGETVSNALLTGRRLAFGFEVKNGKANYSIMNTFEYSLKLSSYLEGLNSSIMKLSFENLGLVGYKSALKKEMKACSKFNKLKSSYQSRLTEAINKSGDHPKLIICGLIAQAFFEEVCALSNIKFGQVMQINVFNKPTKILYVEHPSPRNEYNNTFWVTESTKYQKHNRFINNS